MKLKKIVTSILILTLFVSITTIVSGAFIPVGGNITGLPIVQIKATCPDTGNSITEISYGDVFRVTVYAGNIAGLIYAIPSLHFNPEVVQVSDRYGNILPSANSNSNFFETGFAISNQPGAWDGIVWRAASPRHPFFINETGLIGIAFSQRSSQEIDITEPQAFYSVYFRCISQFGGDPEIRLSRIQDALNENGRFKQPWGNYFDTILTAASQNANANHHYFETRDTADLLPPLQPNVFPPNLTVSPHAIAFNRIDGASADEIKLFVYNTANVPSNAILAIARFDSEGVLTEARVSTAANPPRIAINSENDIFKGMVWHSLQNMQPVSGISTIESMARYL